MATKAELKARLSLDTALFQRGIGLAHSGAARLQSSFSAISHGGTAVFAKLSAAAAALGGVAGFGLALKGAFKLGDELADLSRRTGILPGQLLVMQQAFHDAGVDAGELGLAVNRMQRNMFLAEQRGSALGLELSKIKQLSPDKQFLAIGAAINAIVDPAERAKVAMEIFGRGGGKLLAIFRDTNAMSKAAEAVGQQAEILNKAAETFDKISDQLGHVAVKIRGFFVGVADSISGTLGPLLDKMEKLDFAKMGQDFGSALVKGVATVVGLLSDHQLLTQGLVAGFNAAIASIGNVLIAVFNTAVNFFRDGFVAMFSALGEFIIGVLMNAFQKPLTQLQAGLQLYFEAVQKNLHAKTPMEVYRNFKHMRDPQALADTMADIEAAGGVRMGVTGGGKTSGDWLAAAKADAAKAFSAALEAIKGFAVNDVTGAGESWAQTMEIVRQAIEKGSGIIDAAFGEGGQRIVQAAGTAGLQLGGVGQQHPTGSFINVAGRFFSGVSGERVFGRNSHLSRTEQQDFINQYARVHGTPILTGHQTLREARKEAEKREVEKKLRAEEVQEKSVKLLEDIANSTKDTADAVE